MNRVARTQVDLIVLRSKLSLGHIEDITAQDMEDVLDQLEFLENTVRAIRGELLDTVSYYGSRGDSYDDLIDASCAARVDLAEELLEKFFSGPTQEVVDTGARSGEYSATSKQPAAPSAVEECTQAPNNNSVEGMNKMVSKYYASRSELTRINSLIMSGNSITDVSVYPEDQYSLYHFIGSDGARFVIQVSLSLQDSREAATNGEASKKHRADVGSDTGTSDAESAARHSGRYTEK